MGLYGPCKPHTVVHTGKIGELNPIIDLLQKYNNLFPSKIGPEKSVFLDGSEDNPIFLSLISDGYYLPPKSLAYDTTLHQIRFFCS